MRWVFFDPGWSGVLSRSCRNKSGLDLCPGRSPTCQIGLLPGGSWGQFWQRGRETTDTAFNAEQGGRARLLARARAWEKTPTRGNVSGPTSATRVAGPHLTRCGHTHLRQAAARSLSLTTDGGVGLARVRHVEAHMRPCVDPARTHRSDHDRWSTARLCCKAAAAERTQSGAFTARALSWDRRTRLRGHPIGRSNGSAPTLATSRAAPSSGCIPPCWTAPPAVE